MHLSKVAVIVSRFNPEITNGLLDSFTFALLSNGWKEEQIEVVFVPGAFEIPYFAQKMARQRYFDAIVTFGCVIKGETAHFEYISESVAHALQRVALDESLPVLFGVLTTYTEEQAAARVSKGAEIAEALLELLAAETHTKITGFA